MRAHSGYSIEAFNDIRGNMEFHAIANIFPLIEGKAFDDLVSDVSAHGVREPVWTYEGQILDGRNRWRAAQHAGVECPIREYEGDDPIGFVVSLNLHRRHLSESQRGMVAASIANLEHGQKTRDANLHVSPVTREQAAEMLNVSPRTVASAAKVKEQGTPEVVSAVNSGEMSVNLAAQYVATPEEIKSEVAAEMPDAPVSVVAKEAVKRAHVSNNSGNNEWYTPAKYIEMAREVMGSIDTDPASSEIANRTVKAAIIYTADDDGRVKNWKGNVWMNPPYAQPLMSDFADAVTDKFHSGEIEQACILVNNATETQWFQRMMSAAAAVCFPKGRVRFIDQDGNPGGAPLQGQAIIYMGDRVDEFVGAFSDEGAVLING